MTDLNEIFERQKKLDEERNFPHHATCVDCKQTKCICELRTFDCEYEPPAAG